MNITTAALSNSTPHLTPEKLVGQRFARDAFGDIKIALIGYCPRPSIFEKYHPKSIQNQFFIHLSPCSTEIITYSNMEFLSMFHVYGGPVSAATIEELAYYGFEYVLAYGLAGGLGTKELKMGDYYLVESAYIIDGTTPHYTNDLVVKSDAHLQSMILSHSSDTDLKNIQPVRAITNDAIYRENDDLLKLAIESSCDIINCDSSHLFSVSINNNENKKLRAIQCGVISDVSGNNSSEWDSALSTMLSEQKSNDVNPLERTGAIVEFYIEKLANLLLQK